MKYLKIIAFLFVSLSGFAQKNFIDQPYVTTTGFADTLVVADRVYLNITLSEKDSKGKISTEELEQKMITKLKTLGIDIKKQLTLNRLSSSYQKYLFSGQQVVKSKSYTLLVYDADTAGKVGEALEAENLSNVTLNRLEYSKAASLMLLIKGKAVANARANADALLQFSGQKAGSILQIFDKIENNDRYYTGNIRVRGAQMANFKNSSSDNTYELPEIEFDKVRIQTNVNVIFKIE